MRRAVHVDPEQQSSACQLGVANVPPSRAARSTRPSTASATTGRGDSRCPADSFPHRQCSPGLPAQHLGCDQPKQRDGVYRGFAGTEYVPVSGGHGDAAGRGKIGSVATGLAWHRIVSALCSPRPGVAAGVLEKRRWVAGPVKLIAHYHPIDRRSADLAQPYCNQVHAVLPEMRIRG